MCFCDWLIRLSYVRWIISFFTSTFLGSNVSAYTHMVCETLRNSIPKAVVHCQVREAKRTLLDNFFAEMGKKEVGKDICI